MSMASAVFAWRCRRARRVLEIGRRRELEADLSTYVTVRDRADLLAMLDQYDDDQTAEVRGILARQELREQWRKRPAAGFACR